MEPAEPSGDAHGAARTVLGAEVQRPRFPDCRSAPSARAAAAMLPLTVNFKVSARTLTGALSAHNKAAVDW